MTKDARWPGVGARTRASRRCRRRRRCRGSRGVRGVIGRKVLPVQPHSLAKLAAFLGNERLEVAPQKEEVTHVGRAPALLVHVQQQWGVLQTIPVASQSGVTGTGSSEARACA